MTEHTPFSILNYSARLVADAKQGRYITNLALLSLNNAAHYLRTGVLPEYRGASSIADRIRKIVLEHTDPEHEAAQ